MKKATRSLITLVGCILTPVVNAAAMGTAFTYQGRLNDGGTPANGQYDLEFKLFDGPVSPPAAEVGSVVTRHDTTVSNGLFTVNLDFGNQFPGNARWLEIWANTNLQSVVKLNPRQELTPQPYALYAAQSGSAATAGSAANVPWSGVSELTLGPGLITTAGGFGVDPLFGDDLFWKLRGNDGTTPGLNFLGTRDNQPLIIKTAGAEAMRVTVSRNVGIGTPAPLDKLHVAGSVIFQGPSPWIDVRHYGAKGDGVTDDTGWLQGALDAVPPSGAVVFAPPGTYIVSQPLSIHSGTVLKGAGPSTIFQRRTNGLPTVFFSEGVTNVTAQDFAIDLNGADAGNQHSGATGIGFKTWCSEIRIHDLLIRDSTGADPCCRHGILVLQADHVWIERNHLTDGLRIKAGGITDKVIIADNMLENPNDVGISILGFYPNTQTANCIIRNNVIKAPQGYGITIGADGDGSPNQVYQNIIVDGNLLIGPTPTTFIAVDLPSKIERLHIVNNILSNVGEKLPGTYGIVAIISGRSDYNRPGADFLIANNSLDGAFSEAGIWVASARGVRIANNQITYAGLTPPSHYAIRLGRGGIDGGLNEAVIQGNIARGCHAGLAIENSTKLQITANVFTDMAGFGIGLFTATNTDRVSVQFLGNTVVGTTQVGGLYGQGIAEFGPGTFDTQYLFNDLQNNAGGPLYFEFPNPVVTRLGNRGSDDYVQRHSSGTTAWDPPNVANATSTSTTVSVDGASPGDTVAVGFSESLPPGVLLTGAVTSANTVTVTLANLTGTGVDMNPGTVRADVWKH